MKFRKNFFNIPEQRLQKKAFCLFITISNESTTVKNEIWFTQWNSTTVP